MEIPTLVALKNSLHKEDTMVARLRSWLREVEEGDLGAARTGMKGPFAASRLREVRADFAVAMEKLGELQALYPGLKGARLNESLGLALCRAEANAADRPPRSQNCGPWPGECGFHAEA
jgi:hypothetical protein